MSIRVRLLIVIPNLGRGGAQVVFRQQLKYLSDKFEIWGCVFNWDGSFVSDHETNIVSLDVPAGKSYIGKLRYFILRVIRLNRLSKKLNVDIIISHLEGADYVSLLSMSRARKICWIHGSKNYDLNIKGVVGFIRKRILMKRLYPKADKIITVSNEIRAELTKGFGVMDSNIKTIYNGFDFNLISQYAQESKPNFLEQLKKYPILISHCRMARQKNLSGLIYVMATVSKYRKVKLVLLGDGELRNELIQMSKAVGLQTYSIWDTNIFHEQYDIYFMGYFPNPFSVISNATLYLMTSDWEGFPLALCEAMLCKIPVISTDCYTGPREILAPDFRGSDRVFRPFWGEYGVLMPLVNVRSLEILNYWSDTILSFLDNVELKNRYSINAERRARDFSIRESIDRTGKIINEIL